MRDRPWAVQAASRRGIYYGWLVVGVTLVSALVGSGLRMASGVLVKPLEAEFGWDRAEISLAFALGLLANGLGGPFGGKLMDRFGPRRVVMGALSLSVLGCLGMLLMHNIVQLTV